MYFVSIIFLVFIPKSSHENLNLSSRYGNNSNNLKISNEKIQPAIIGGYEAEIDEVPFGVRLLIHYRRLFSMCTGQAVHSHLVLTAAHCVKGNSEVIVVTGKGDMRDYVRDYKVHRYARYKVIQKFIHPDFDKDLYVHDVALLKTGRPMLHHGHAVVPLNYTPWEGVKQAKIFGWGRTEINTDNHQLYAKEVKAKRCVVTLMSQQREYVCLLEQGINHGDSGGGLLIDGVLRAIASFYNPVPDVQYRYYYTDISVEADFVTSCIARNSCNYNSCFTVFIFFFYFVTFFLR